MKARTNFAILKSYTFVFPHAKLTDTVECRCQLDKVLKFNTVVWGQQESDEC